MKKHLKLVLAAAMSLAMLSGCGDSSSTDTGTSTPTPTVAAPTEAPVDPVTPDELEPVTLKIILFGDKRQETDAVFAKMAEQFRDELNVDYEVSFFAGSDYAERLIAQASSGADWDLNFDGDWLAYSRMVNNNAYLDVSTLLPQYAPDLYAVYQENGLIDAVSVNNKLFALPWTMRMNQRPIVQWNKKYADDAGLTFTNDSIKTIEDLDALFTALRTAYPEKRTFDTSGVDRLFWAKHQLTQLNYDFVYDTTAENPTLVHYAMTDAYMEHATWAKKWMDDGVSSRDVLTNPFDGNALIADGEIISNVSWHEWVYAINNWGGIIGTPEENRYHSVIYPDNQFPNRTPLANIMTINRNAKNPERALMFLNMVETNQEFYDMLHFGIEGVTYKLGANGEADYPTADMNGGNSNYMEWGGQWAMWKPQFMRPNATYPSGFWNAEADFAALPMNVNSNLIGFFPDLSSVENEIVMVKSTFDELNQTINVGLSTDPEAAVLAVRAALKDAGLDVVTAEYQRQVDEFLANN